MLCTTATNTSNTMRTQTAVPPNANPAVWILIRVIMWLVAEDRGTRSPCALPRSFALPASSFWRPLSRLIFEAVPRLPRVLCWATLPSSSSHSIPFFGSQAKLRPNPGRCGNSAVTCRCRQCTACCISEFMRPAGIELQLAAQEHPGFSLCLWWIWTG